jgi:hypothetical protein
MIQRDPRVALLTTLRIAAAAGDLGRPSNGAGPIEAAVAVRCDAVLPIIPIHHISRIFIKLTGGENFENR